MAKKSLNLRVPCLFDNNLACGVFVRTLVFDLKQAFEKKTSFHKFDFPTISTLFKSTEANANKKIIIDDSIYTKNRQFRMFGSCKFGREDVFAISRLNKFNDTPTSSQDLITLSLVGIYQPSHENDPAMFFLDSKRNVSYKPVRLSNQVVPPKTLKSNDGQDHLLEIYKNYFQSMAKPGEIKTVAHLGNEQFRINFTQGYKYCANVGRHHANNNIFVIFDQKNVNYEQRCHDEQCRNFSTGKLPINFLLPPKLPALPVSSTSSDKIRTGIVSKFFAKIQVMIFYQVLANFLSKISNFFFIFFRNNINKILCLLIFKSLKHFY